jgi:hypothetical protein
MKDHTEISDDPTLGKFCVFAVGDTFGNVGLFKESLSETGKKTEPLFVYRNTEISYSIESLSYDPSGKILVASSSKHFVILFYLGQFDFLKNNVRKISPQEYFKQNHLISRKHKMSGTLTYKNFNETIYKEQIPKPVEQATNKMNKPVFYRKGSKRTPVKVITKTPNQSISIPKSLSKPGAFLLNNEKSTYLKEKAKPQFISVINLLKPMKSLVSNDVFSFDDGQLIYSIQSEGTGRNQLQKVNQQMSLLGLSQAISSSGYFDFNSVKSSLKVIFRNTSKIQWEKKFEGLLQTIEINSKFVVVLDKNSKLSVFRTGSGRRALFSFEAHNLFKVSLSQENKLLLVRRNGYFSVIDLETQKVQFSGNCFELLKNVQESSETLFEHSQVRFLLGENSSIFLKIFTSLYLYNPNIQQWQIISNTVFYAAFEGIPNKIKEFEMLKFPNDPGDIFDTTPFELLQASSNISKINKTSSDHLEEKILYAIQTNNKSLFSKSVMEYILELYKTQQINKIFQFLVDDILVNKSSSEHQFLLSLNVSPIAFYRNGIEILKRVKADPIILERLQSIGNSFGVN